MASLSRHRLERVSWHCVASLLEQFKLFCNLLKNFSLIWLVLRTEIIFKNEKDFKKNCFQILILYVILTRLG